MLKVTNFEKYPKGYRNSLHVTVTKEVNAMLDKHCDIASGPVAKFLVKKGIAVAGYPVTMTDLRLLQKVL